MRGDVRNRARACSVSAAAAVPKAINCVAITQHMIWVRRQVGHPVEVGVLVALQGTRITSRAVVLDSMSRWCINLQSLPAASHSRGAKRG